MGLDTLGLLESEMEALMTQVYQWIDATDLDFTIKKTAQGPLLQCITKQPQKGNDALEKLLGFVSLSIFTPQFRPTEKIRQDLLQALSGRINRELLLKKEHGLEMIKLEEFLLELGPIFNVEWATPNDFPLHDPPSFMEIKRNTLLRTEILETVKEMLDAEDPKTVFVEDATERGGLSAILGKKYGSIKDKIGQSDFQDFKLVSCHVSVQAQSLVEMIHQTLGQMEPQDLPQNAQRCTTVRHILAMYRAVRPLQIKDQCHDPSLAMIFYNDCIYICHHLSTLGYTHQGCLPEELKSLGTFVDEIPPLYEYGQQCLKAELVF